MWLYIYTYHSHSPNFVNSWVLAHVFFLSRWFIVFFRLLRQLFPAVRRKSPFAQCLVEFNKPDGSLHGESWLFHMDAAFEDTRRRADRGEGARGGDWNWGRISLISPKCQFFMGKMIEQWFWASQFSQKTMSVDGLAADRNAAVGVDSYPYSWPTIDTSWNWTMWLDLLAKIFVVSRPYPRLIIPIFLYAKNNKLESRL